MKAVKGNREYTIDESQQKRYQDAGFDLVENGTIIAYGRGKTVPYGEFIAVKQELDAIKAQKEPRKKAGE